MKKVLGLVLTVVLMTSLFAGCTQKNNAPVTDAPAGEQGEETGKEAGAKADETYVFMCPLANLEYWQAYRVGLEDACAELGVTANSLVTTAWRQTPCVQFWKRQSTILQQQALLCRGISPRPMSRTMKWHGKKGFR